MAARTDTLETKKKLEKELKNALAAIRRLQAKLDSQDTPAAKASMPKGLHDKMVERAIRRKAEGKLTRKEKGVLTHNQNVKLREACNKLIAKEGLKGRVWVGGDMNAWREAARCIIDDGFAFTQAAEVFVDTFDEKAAKRALKARQSK